MKDCGHRRTVEFIKVMSDTQCTSLTRRVSHVIISSASFMEGPAGQRPAKCHICHDNAYRRSILTAPQCPQPSTALPVYYRVPISGLAHNSYCHIVIRGAQQTMSTATVA
ncbi:hypothetical protein PAMP_020004 [Pampus punctatissimus]